MLDLADRAVAADAATGYVRLPRPLTPLLRAALPAGIVGEHHHGQIGLRPFTVVGAGYGGVIGDVLDAEGRPIQVELSRERFLELQPAAGERFYITPRNVRVFLMDRS